MRRESVANQLVRTKTIRGEHYSLTLLEVEHSEEALVRLIELLGPAFIDTLSSEQVLGQIVGAAKADRAVDAALLAELARPLADAARGVISRLRRDDLSFFAGVFKPVTKVGKGAAATPLADIYSVHFAGKLGAMREWLVWCMWEHFSDFFVGGDAIKGVFAAVQKSAQETASE